MRTFARTGCFWEGGARLLALLFALSPLLSCGNDEQPPPLELALGTGEVAFEAAEDGDTLTLYAGTQGGHHVWLSMRMRGFEPQGTTMILEVIPEPPAPPARTEVSLYFAERSGPVEDNLPFEYVGWPARVLAPECAVAGPVLLRVQLSDESGHMLTRELKVLAGAPRLPFSDACEL